MIAVILVAISLAQSVASVCNDESILPEDVIDYCSNRFLHIGNHTLREEGSAQNYTNNITLVETFICQESNRGEQIVWNQDVLPSSMSLWVPRICKIRFLSIGMVCMTLRTAFSVVVSTQRILTQVLAADGDLSWNHRCSLSSHKNYLQESSKLRLSTNLTQQNCVLKKYRTAIFLQRYSNFQSFMSIIGERLRNIKYDLIGSACRH